MRCPDCVTAEIDHGRARNRGVRDPEYAKNYYARNPEKFKNAQLYYRHGITIDQYRKMLADQGGGCAVCGDTPTKSDGQRDFHVDHDHRCCPGNKSCGQCIRGILCHYCNIGLGGFRDSPEKMLTAISYLARGVQMLLVA